MKGEEMQQNNWHPAVAAAEGQPERLFRTDQAAVRLKCDESTIRRRCRNRLLLGVKISPRKWMIPEGAIRDYLKTLNQE